MIFICQLKYYPTKIRELTKKYKLLEISLKNFAFDNKMKEYTEMSMQLLKAELCKRYNQQKREPYTISELRQKSNAIYQRLSCHYEHNLLIKTELIRKTLFMIM